MSSLSTAMRTFLRLEFSYYAGSYSQRVRPTLEFRARGASLLEILATRRAAIRAVKS